jgi:hypothetical protein
MAGTFWNKPPVALDLYPYLFPRPFQSHMSQYFEQEAG